MCVAVYIASDHPLPTVAWDKAHPAFHVSDATDGYFYPGNPLRKHFSQPYLYAAGSHDGCGCGFQPYGGHWDDRGEYVEDTTPEQVATWHALAAFLSAALQHQPAVGVLVCGSGDEPTQPERHRRARPADFLWDRTLFDMGQVVLVSEQDAAPGT